MNNIYLTVTPFPGAVLGEVYDDALALSRQLDAVVVFGFNGTRHYVHWKADAEIQGVIAEMGKNDA